MARLKRTSWVFTRLKASSLIELTVAMIIITTVFAMSMAIYLSIQKNNMLALKLNYTVIMDNVFIERSQKSDFSSGEVVIGNYSVFIEEQAFRQQDNLKIIYLEVRDQNGKLRGQQRRLVYVPIR